MAPQKPATNDKAQKAKKTSTDKQSKDEVVKRPARGYHTFRNGMLNVTPKGGEKDIVEANRKSPLLRLPAEVRNMIWEFALGGRAYEAKRDGYRMHSQGDPSRVALLRVCRQIYAEAVNIPMQQSVFSIPLHYPMRECFSRFKTGQRRQITSLRFEISLQESQESLSKDIPRLFSILKLPKYLPGLKKVVFCIIIKPKVDTIIKQTMEDKLRCEIEAVSSDMNLEIGIEQKVVE